jgi:predicted nucleotide-binding protein
MFGPSPTVQAMETGTDVSDDFITGAAGHNRKAMLSNSQLGLQKNKSTEKVFIVHGHDNALKDEIYVFLKGIGLEPIVLHRQPDGGLTVRARQNVIFELGFWQTLPISCLLSL